MEPVTEREGKAKASELQRMSNEKRIQPKRGKETERVSWESDSTEPDFVGSQEEASTTALLSRTLEMMMQRENTFQEEAKRQRKIEYILLKTDGGPTDQGAGTAGYANVMGIRSRRAQSNREGPSSRGDEEQEEQWNKDAIKMEEKWLLLKAPRNKLEWMKQYGTSASEFSSLENL